ncbi:MULTISPECIES: hypothetical protein [unclassified Pseudofrankia]|uniref:hypothetical protein n=1 Tax=unclassified Pseudofrankia TaxID=2994372 RepID=UPI0009F2143B|nr:MULTISPECIES: hypothetical protein [unclassified Pseudofrankia]MDT3438616.1 hypothetical protein [Pseudofrankia sp. BMG5.37]
MTKPVPMKPETSLAPSSKEPSGLLAINLRYFALRAVLFGAVLAAVLLLGVNGWLAFFAALVVSGIMSFPLALRQRRAAQRAFEIRRGQQ